MTDKSVVPLAQERITLTSDGKTIVYGVFSADGYECEFLDAIFGTDEKAQQHAEFLRAQFEQPDEYGYRRIRKSGAYVYGEHISVKPIVLGERMKP